MKIRTNRALHCYANHQGLNLAYFFFLLCVRVCVCWRGLLNKMTVYSQTIDETNCLDLVKSKKLEPCFIQAYVYKKWYFWKSSNTINNLYLVIAQCLSVPSNTCKSVWKVIAGLTYFGGGVCVCFTYKLQPLSLTLTKMCPVLSVFTRQFNGSGPLK